MHKLLERQIKKLRRKSADGSFDIDELLDIVSQTYEESDDARRRNDRSMRLVSEELLALNKQIKDDSKNAFTMITENVVDGVFTFSEDGIILSFNRAMEKMFKASGSAMIGQPITLLTPEGSDDFYTIYHDHFNTGNRDQAYESMAKNNMGEPFPIGLTVSRMETQGGSYFIAVVRDISERKAFQQALIEAKENALQASEAKTNFLSTMSHEIRTPMNAVIGLTNLLLQENPRPDQIENLKTLKFSGENLLVLINDILDFNKIEAGKLEVEKIDFCLREIINNVEKSLGLRAREKGVLLRIVADTDLPGLVIGDPTRLSQVLLNLVSNAIKFTEEGEVRLLVSKLKSEHDDWVIHFAVEDTGIGIPAEKIGLIFDNFTQSNSSITRQYGGTGLGLAICKRLVELQGGEINVNSMPDQGSIFSFALPFAHSQLSSIDIESNENPDQPRISTFEPANILLVEDNVVNQMVASQFFCSWGLNVDIAGNGQIGIEKILKKDYDLVIMDLQMPVMDGYAAAREIRKLEGSKYQKLKIIALTASVRAVESANMYKYGINAFISKPFDPVELNQLIARFVKVCEPHEEECWII